MIGCGHCSVPDGWGISIDLGRSPPMPPQASVNRAMTVSGPPSASTPREYEESGGSYEDCDEQPDRQPALMPNGAVAAVRPWTTYIWSSPTPRAFRPFHWAVESRCLLYACLSQQEFIHSTCNDAVCHSRQDRPVTGRLGRRAQVSAAGSAASSISPTRTSMTSSRKRIPVVRPSWSTALATWEPDRRMAARASSRSDSW
jgi:hypothetical protein